MMTSGRYKILGSTPAAAITTKGRTSDEELVELPHARLVTFIDLSNATAGSKTEGYAGHGDTTRSRPAPSSRLAWGWSQPKPTRKGGVKSRERFPFLECGRRMDGFCTLRNRIV